MQVTITPHLLSGRVQAIPSKSIAHRMLICAALANEKTTIQNLFDSKDILATKACLSAMGCGFEGDTVIPIYKSENAVLNCNESGSTFRFLLPIVMALGGKFTFNLAGRLPQRPLSPLYELLQRHGCKLSPQGSNPFLAEGKLTAGHFEIAGNVSSQFISGLLLALPLLNGDSAVHITSDIESKPYVDITQSVQALFGIEMPFENNTFYIKGNQSYRSPHKTSVEGDWSNAAFWYCANAMGSQIDCIGLNSYSVQGDRQILKILQDLPCTVCAKDIPDLIPAVCAVAAVTAGQTVITHAERLILKESNRLSSIRQVLTALGASVLQTANGLIIKGTPKLTGGTVDACNDHRIAMMAAVASIACTDTVTITNAEAVQKSYPHFWTDFKALGGIIKEEA